MRNFPINTGEKFDEIVKLKKWNDAAGIPIPSEASYSCQGVKLFDS